MRVWHFGFAKSEAFFVFRIYSSNDESLALRFRKKRSLFLFILADYELDRSEIKAVMCSLSDTCDSEYFGIFSRISPLGVPLVRHRIKLRKNLLKILEIPPLTEGLNCAFCNRGSGVCITSLTLRFESFRRVLGGVFAQQIRTFERSENALFGFQ